MSYQPPKLDAGSATLPALRQHTREIAVAVSNAYQGRVNVTPNGATVTRPLPDKLGEFLSVEDFGAVGDDATVDNQEAFQAAFDYVKSIGGGNIWIPPRAYYMAGVASTGTDGVYSSGSIRGRQAVYLKDAENIRVFGSGPASRLIRTDASQTAQDKYSQHILVENCTGIEMTGFTCVGLQDDTNLDSGTGNGIHLFRGTHNVKLHDLWFEQCGAGAAIMLGDNRVSSGVTYDLAAPVYDVDIENITVQNSRYFCVAFIARDIRINGWRHRKAAHAGLGTPQNGHIRRSLYLLSCRDIQATGGRIRGAHKTALMLAAYPTTRSLGDLKNITLSDIHISGADDTTDSDFHTGIWFDNQNTDAAAISRYVNIDISGVEMDGVLTGMYFDDSNDTTGITATKMIDGLRVRGMSIRSSTNGIDLSAARVFSAVSFDQLDVEVLTANADTGSPGVGFRVANSTASGLGASATVFHQPLSITHARIRSGNRTMQITGCANVYLGAVDTGYVADGVSSPQTADLAFNSCGVVFSPDTRLSGSGNWTKTTMASAPVMLSLALTAGEDTATLVNTGIATSRSATGFRGHWTLSNPNGAVGQVGSRDSGLEIKSLIAGTTSRLTDSSGNKLVEWGQTGGSAALGFYGATAIAKPAGVAVTDVGIHAALVSLGLIAP